MLSQALVLRVWRIKRGAAKSTGRLMSPYFLSYHFSISSTGWTVEMLVTRKHKVSFANTYQAIPTLWYHWLVIMKCQLISSSTGFTIDIGAKPDDLNFAVSLFFLPSSSFSLSRLLWGDGWARSIGCPS